jgi:ABC-type multidrug transport system fused ATPase/permease subunit
VFSQKSYGSHHQTSKFGGMATAAPGIGSGIGMAIGLLLMQLLASACTHHFFYRGASSGVLLRAGLITAIYRRALRLTSRARSTLPNGKLVNHISTDVSRIDFCCGFFHMAWSAPIQLLVCLVILLVQLGPSALTGFAFFVLVTPVQTRVMQSLFTIRKKSMAWTDKRAKLLQELLGGMKIIKFFAWEVPFLRRIGEFRQKEVRARVRVCVAQLTPAQIHYIRNLLMIRAANNAVAMSLPVLASVLSFTTYSLSGHSLDPAIIFTSLTLFQMLRLPLMFLPMSFSAIADARNAVSRITPIFEAEQLSETKRIDPGLQHAIVVEDAEFTWDGPPPEDKKPAKAKGLKARMKALRGKGKTDAAATPATPATPGTPDEEHVFQLHGVNMVVPRGKLVAIVGPVGTGKTSLLEGLIGEMRRTAGTVTFGGSVGYCPQSAWIQNATIRQNITFGRAFEDARYWAAVRASCLEPDLDMLPHGDLTEVGEKGISLSGGQKQRLNICRAIYCDADVQIYDDPLSALDAHVGKAVFHNVLANAAPGKTRVLVTHALHFLPEVDYIYTLVQGRIAEHGTYADLMRADGEFARFVTEFGSQATRPDDAEKAAEMAIEDAAADAAADAADAKRAEKRRKASAGKALMQAEERNTGSVSGQIYGAYIRAGDGKLLVPLLLLTLALIQGATVLSSYWLVWWQADAFHRPPGFYMGIYAALGVSQASAMFLMGVVFSLFTYAASRNLHRAAITRVIHAPMSFFETTPLGRIMNRFAKDVDTLDNLLGDALRMFANTFANILGAIILISILLPWFLIAVAGICSIYYFYAIFYRSSARELKVGRRPPAEAHCVLTRIPAARRAPALVALLALLRVALGARDDPRVRRGRAVRARQPGADGHREPRVLAHRHQPALARDPARLPRLAPHVRRRAPRRRHPLHDLARADGRRALVHHLRPGRVRLDGPPERRGRERHELCVPAPRTCAAARADPRFAAVERIIYYATQIEQEAAYEIEATKPPPAWPSAGAIEVRDMVFRYRPELPPVIKGISMSIRGGEKIGIVGRTGAGKSTIMSALYRIVELSGGTIEIDGVDIAKLGLLDLRKKLAIIPQDPLLCESGVPRGWRLFADCCSQSRARCGATSTPSASTTTRTCGMPSGARISSRTAALPSPRSRPATRPRPATRSRASRSTAPSTTRAGTCRSASARSSRSRARSSRTRGS